MHPPVPGQFGVEGRGQQLLLADYHDPTDRRARAHPAEGLRSRAELVDGSPRLQVLDWYGGVRTLDGNHPIWSAYFGAGLPVTTGAILRGRVVLAAGGRP